MKAHLAVLFTIVSTLVIDKFVTNNYVALFLIVLTIGLAGLNVANSSYKKENV